MAFFLLFFQSLSYLFQNVPGSIVKGCCRSVGIEGLPNIPVINKMNIGEIAKYVDKVCKIIT